MLVICHRISQLLLMVLICLVAIPPSVHATEDWISFDEIVVTAARISETKKKLPASVTVIDQKEISQSVAENVAGLLEKNAGIKIVSQGSGAQSFLDLRGMGGDNPFGKVLVLLDGVRINNMDMSSINFLTIPVGDVERIEVVRGSMASLYGDSAIAGVINIISKTQGKGLSADASVITGSHGELNGKIMASYSCGTSTIRLCFEELESAGYRERAALSSQSTFISLVGEPLPGLSTSGRVSFNKMNYQMPGALTKGEMELNRRAYQPARPSYFTPAHDSDEALQDTLRANLQANYPFSEEGSINIDLAYAQKQIESDMASFATYTTTAQKTFTLMPRISWSGPLGGIPQRMVLGVDYYNEPFALEKFTSATRSVRASRADICRESTGWYLQEEVQAVPEKLFFSVGFRQEQADIAAKQLLIAAAETLYDTKKIHKAQAFDLGATFVGENGFKVFVKHSQAYRLPFIDEQVYYYGFASDQFLQDLEREKSRTIELGTQWSLFTSLFLEANVFRTDMEDEIVYNDAERRNENLDKTRHEGAELFISYDEGDFLRLRLKYSYHIAKFLDGIDKGKELPLVPNHQLTLSGEIALLPPSRNDLPFRLTLHPSCRFVDSSYLSGDRSNKGPRLDSYSVIDAVIFLRGKEATEKWRFFVGIENLLNTAYSTYGVAGTSWSPEVYYPMPKRTFKIGVNLPF
ncbi:MAG: TonB-dependent receptor [Deltaproteobacteria bacterium]|nr:TonB-dependent receptor [Deltaproteobacteria bacterium]